MQFVYTCIKLQACTSLSISTCIDERIRSFLQYYRLEFPDASITPKLHILEEHVVPWMKRWKVALEFHNEQGGESIHAKFNQLQRQFVCIKDSLKRLELTIKEHHTQIQATNTQPPTKIMRI